jgi:hypothetical protein
MLPGPLLRVSGLSLLCLLSACAGPMPKADPSEAWIGLEQPASNDLLAERIDGQRVDDSRYFELTPGAHRLEMTLISGADGNTTDLNCFGRLDYRQFKAGEHYHMVASNTGESAGVNLVDSHGKEVAQSDSFSCT